MKTLDYDVIVGIDSTTELCINIDKPEKGAKVRAADREGLNENSASALVNLIATETRESKK